MRKIHGNKKKGRGGGEELRRIHILHPREEEENEIQEEAVKEGKRGDKSKH